MMKMGKFKVNSKTGILFCIVLLDSVSGLPFQKNDHVDGKTDDSVIFLEDNPSALLTRIRRELHYDSEDDESDDETSDEASAPVEPRFGFHGRGRKPKSFQEVRAGKFPFFANTMNGDHPYFPFHYGYQPLFGSGSLEFGAGYHGPMEGFGPWNNGHGHKYGHGPHHEFHDHHHGCGPNYQGGYGPSYDQDHHNGFENHPWKKPGYNYKPPSGFDVNEPSANGPWSDGFLDKVDTTTQKTTTLPQIDIRIGDH